VNYRNREFLLTAAHVYDERKLGQLFVFGVNGMVQIVGQVAESIAPSKDRNLDKLDFTCIILNNDTVLHLESSSFIVIEDCMADDLCVTHKYAVAIGYPRSKHKKWTSVKHPLRIKSYRHISRIVTKEHIFKNAGFSSETHYFLQFDELHSRNKIGCRINSLSPVGLSGGGFFVMTSPIEVKEECFVGRCSFKLAGILIEQFKEDSVLISTRISTICEGMDAQLEHISQNSA